MAPRILAEDKFKMLISELAARYKNGEKAAYSVKDIQMQNPDLKTTYLREWVRKFASKDVESYLMEIGIISEKEYYDDAFTTISLEQIRGKTFFIFASSERQKIDITTMLLDYGATITDDLSDSFDFVITDRRFLYKKPEESNRLLAKIIRLLGEHISGRFVICHELLCEYDREVRLRIFTPEQRTEMGLIVSSQYPGHAAEQLDETLDVCFCIDQSMIPVYDPSKAYWSLEYFQEWYGASGGEIRAELSDYSNDTSFDNPERIQSSFECFEKICKQIDSPKIKSFVYRTLNKNQLTPGQEIVIASVGYIEDFSGYWAIVGKAKRNGTFQVLLEKKPVLVHSTEHTDYDCEIEQFSAEGIPQRLRVIVQNQVLDFEERGKEGYYHVESKSGTIPKAAFANDPKIKHLEISDNIDKIEYRAFENCPELETVIIGKSVVVIGPDAFAGCRKIKKIAIPDSVKELTARCFQNCSALKEVSFGSLSSCAYIGNGTFSGCDQLESIKIPDLVEEISFRAFENCRELRSIAIPYALRTIGDYAFSGCASLSEVLTPGKNQFWRIGTDVFKNCEKLKDEQGQYIIAGYCFK